MKFQDCSPDDGPTGGYSWPEVWFGEVTWPYCLNSKSRRSARCYKKVNSAPELIQKTPRRLLRDYVLHRTRCTQEDDRLLREGRGWSCVSGRQDWIDPPGAG